MSRRRSVSTSIPVRFGGSASRVAVDNIPHLELHSPNFNETQLSTANEDDNRPAEDDRHSGQSQADFVSSSFEVTNRLAAILAQTTAKIGERSVSKIMEILGDDRFSLPDFTSRFRSASDCKAHVDTHFDSEMSELGFMKSTIEAKEEHFSCTFFHRNPVSVLQQQISEVTRESMSIKPRADIDRQGRQCFSHPTSAELGKTAIPAVEIAIKRSSSRDVFWREGETHSFVGLGQIYSDKTQTSLRANGLALYPVHVILLNHQEQERRKFISSGQSTVAFLPVDFLNTEQQVGTAKMKRNERMSLLHTALKDVFKPLTAVAVAGFPCITSDKIGIHCHFVLANYCCDLPEAKDMLGLKYGSMSKYGCHRCYAENSEMSETIIARPRNMSDVRECRNESRLILTSSDLPRRRKKALECLEGCSLSEYSSFLEDFPFSNIHSLLDIHNVFSFELLHNIYLGVSKLLKEMASKRLMNASLMTTLHNSRNEPKSFLVARPDLINGINHLLACIERENPMKGMRIDLSTPGKGYSYNGVFKQEGLIGMLEARDHRTLDQVMPFIAMFLDRCCGEVKTTTLFVLYVDMVNRMVSRGVDPVWSESKLRTLEVAIEKFRKEAKDLYSQYQPSGMGTPKMHLLDHVCSDIRRNGGLQYSDSSYFEHSHVSAKEHYRGTSRRKSSAMDETVKNFERNVFFQSLPGSNSNVMGATRKGARVTTFNDDIVSLVRRGKQFTYYQLKETYLERRQEQQGRKRKLFELSNNVSSFLDDVGMVACRMMITLLRESFCVQKPHQIMHLAIQQVASGFVNGGFLPTAKDVVQLEDELMIQFHEPRRKVSQRFISTSSYYNQGRKHDCVLIESDRIKRNGSPARMLWAAKVLGLFRIKELDAEESEYAFIQYFDVVESTSDAMKVLECVNLKLSRCDRSDENTGTLEGWYDIVPASSIRSVVHVITVDYAIRNVCGDIPWYDKIYHINRFYHDPDELTF